MRKLFIASILLLFATSASATITIFQEDFAYDIGLLEDVSGGRWTHGSQPDWACVAQMAIADSIGMNETQSETFMNPLQGENMTAKVSFDFFLHEEGDYDIDPYIWFENLSDNMFMIQVDKDNDPSDVGLVRFNNQFHSWVTIGDGLALDTWHNITVDLTQTVDPLSNGANDPDGTLDVYIDGVIAPVGPFSFKNNDLSGAYIGCHVWRGFNPDPHVEDHDFVALDNIVITGIPEPGTMALLGLGLLGLLRKRR